MAASDRQRDIIDAALELLHAQGMQELTMKRIAAAIGVSEPALYKHFASKAEILAAVVDELEATRTSAVVASRAANADPLRSLAAFFEAHARQFTTRPALMSVLFSDDLFRHDRTLSVRVAGIIKGTRALIEEEIGRGKDMGLLRQEVNEEAAGLMLAGGFRLLVAGWRLDDMPFDLVLRTDAFIDEALSLLRKETKT